MSQDVHCRSLWTVKYITAY